MDKKERIEELINIIDELDYHYYTLDNPKLSDMEYDRLYKELEDLEAETGIIKDYSPTQRVGGYVLEKFEKHEHLQRLWSLDKSQSPEELREWDQRNKRLIGQYNQENQIKLPDLEYILEWKFDGLTINLTYENGYLKQGASRGNGVTGEAILHQIKTIRGIPFKIKHKGLIEIQGEGLMPISEFEKYNKKAEEPLKNPRNGVAGALRNLDTRVTASRKLKAFFYNIGYSESLNLESQEDILGFLRENKLPVYPYYEKFKDMEEIIEKIEEMDKERKNIDYLTDGLVIKINDLRTRQALGYTNKFPRWAIAYKFEAEEISTRLLEVIWNVGRTSKVTPSAILEAVEIGGVTVKRATLNNYDDIIRKNLRLNSRVLIRRSNDVIPEILGVLHTEEETLEIKKPDRCPYCNSELYQRGVHIFCPNKISCKPQLIARLKHFSSRDAMNIEGFSEKTLEKLIEELGIDEIAKIYDLSYDDLIKLDGFKEKKTKNILGAIERSKEVKLSAFIYALGIGNVGIKTAKDLSLYYKSLDKLKEASYDELLNIGEIGPIIARDIVEFFANERNIEGINSLLGHGVNISSDGANKGEGVQSIFKDKLLVITGSIEGIKRSEIKDFIESRGGRVSGSVSKNTDLVIIGENPGSKYDKARELGIETIDESILKELMRK